MHNLPVLAQEEQYALLVEHTGALLALLDQDGYVLHVNPACQHMLGYEPEDILGDQLRDLLHPDDLPTLRTNWQQVLDAGNGQFICRICHEDGSWRCLETHATHAEHGDQYYVVVASHDITEHKQAQAEWQRNNELFRVMVDSVKDYAIFATDSAGHIATWNPGAQRLFGYAEDEIVGQHGSIIFTPEDHAAGADRQELHTAATTGRAQDERWHLRKDGSRFWASGMTTPLRDEDGQIQGFVKVARDDTERKQAENEREQLIRALDAERTQFETVLESISDAFYAVDKDFCFTYINNQAEAWWKRQRHELIGQHYWTVFPAVVGSESYHKHLQVMTERQPVHYETFSPLVRRWVSVSIYPAQDGGLAVYFQDITARKQAEEQLRASEERFRALVTQAAVGIAETNAGRFTYVNDRFCAITGRRREDLIGTLVSDITHPDDAERDMELLARMYTAGEAFVVDKRYVRPDGSLVWVLTSVTPIRGTDGKIIGGFAASIDVTARKQAEEQLQYQAAHDVLTGLPNRATFLDHVRRALARHERHPEYCFAILFLDLDRFKVINDSLGHLIGDQLLIETARRLQQCVRPEDVVARLGGDEFVILLDNIHDVHDARTVADRIHAAVASPLTLHGHEVATATSIGITLSEPRCVQPEDMLRDADTAMYLAKRHGPERTVVFNHSMHAAAMARLWMETELKHAVERGELRLAYQPLVELATGRVYGVEALVRWQHGQRGVIMPGDFIPVAEETGSIHAIGRWVLREACQQLRRWQQQFPMSEPWTVSVNLSGVQCHHSDLVPQVERILRETGLTPHCLQLEVTESVLLGDADTAIALFRDLQALGVQLTLDDFGTGYSSLSYLHHFPVSTLKIDRSFISTLDNEEHGGLVGTITTLARNMRMDVVAEGVETAAQRDRLAALGCKHAQGYFFARPLDAATIERLLADEERVVGER